MAKQRHEALIEEQLFVEWIEKTKMGFSSWVTSRMYAEVHGTTALLSIKEQELQEYKKNLESGNGHIELLEETETKKFNIKKQTIENRNLLNDMIEEWKHLRETEMQFGGKLNSQNALKYKERIKQQFPDITDAEIVAYAEGKKYIELQEKTNEGEQ